MQPHLEMDFLLIVLCSCGVFSAALAGIQIVSAVRKIPRYYADKFLRRLPFVVRTAFRLANLGYAFSFLDNDFLASTIHQCLFCAFCSWLSLSVVRNMFVPGTPGDAMLFLMVIGLETIGCLTLVFSFARQYSKYSTSKYYRNV